MSVAPVYSPLHREAMLVDDASWRRRMGLSGLGDISTLDAGGVGFISGLMVGGIGGAVVTVVAIALLESPTRKR